LYHYHCALIRVYQELRMLFSDSKSIDHIRRIMLVHVLQCREMLWELFLRRWKIDRSKIFLRYAWPVAIYGFCCTAWSLLGLACQNFAKSMFLTVSFLSSRMSLPAWRDSRLKDQKPYTSEPSSHDQQITYWYILMTWPTTSVTCLALNQCYVAYTTLLFTNNYYFKEICQV